jgi:phosphoribosyl 1,2-cyclic phosphodiesterase
MKVISLQSGSNGNSIYVEAGAVRLLFDAGISGSLIEERLALHGRDDPDMLANGSYPQWLKARITGPAGHISNFDAAELLSAFASKRMQWVCLGHLSHENNAPKLALATHRKILGNRLPLFVATRHEVSEVMEIE